METNYTVPQKPTLVSVIAWTTLASGIVNLGWGLAASAAAFLTIIGICCVPLTILPTILGVFEIIYAAKLLSTPAQPVKPAVNLAVLEVVCILTGNFFTMIVGVLSLIFYNDPTVKDYFARLNGTLPPEPVPPSPQIPPVVPAAPSPAEEPIPSPIHGETPLAPAAPLEEELVEETPLQSPQTPVPPESPAPVDEAVITSIRRDGVPENEIVPPVPPAAPEAPTATDETMISSVRRDGMPDTEPEPPAPPDEPDTSDKNTEG